MNQLLQKASEFKADQEFTKTSREQAKLEAGKRLIFELAEEFEARFGHFIPSFIDLNINWQIKLQDARYIHRGTYVEFWIPGSKKSVKMDFSGRHRYRLEFVPFTQPYGSMAYGNWPDESFANFLVEGLAIAHKERVADMGI